MVGAGDWNASKEGSLPVALIQEFAITNRSTANYDLVKESLGADPVDGLIIHTPGFDDDNVR